MVMQKNVAFCLQFENNCISLLSQNLVRIARNILFTPDKGCISVRISSVLLRGFGELKRYTLSLHPFVNKFLTTKCQNLSRICRGRIVRLMRTYSLRDRLQATTSLNTPRIAMVPEYHGGNVVSAHQLRESFLPA